MSMGLMFSVYYGSKFHNSHLASEAINCSILEFSNGSIGIRTLLTATLLIIERIRVCMTRSRRYFAHGK